LDECKILNYPSIAPGTVFTIGLFGKLTNQRLKSIGGKELTDEWKSRGIKRRNQFATLTDIITKSLVG
jgi:hypothetical protein